MPSQLIVPEQQILSFAETQPLAFLRQQANGAFNSNVFVVATAQNPFDDANVVTEARPHKLAAFLTEPVHVEDLWHLQAYNIGADTLHVKANLVWRLGQIEPMLHVLAKVVAKEWTHGKCVVHDRLGRMLGGGGRLRLELHADKDAMRPGKRLVDKWHALRASAAKDERLDWHTSRVLPLRVNDWTLRRDRCEATIWMRRYARFANLPLLAEPCCDRAVLKRLLYSSSA